MGKNKQAQRTKNNARPSNSSRSAELLGSAMPNFVGFSAVKDGGYVPVLPGLTLCSHNEIEMSNVDSNFQIVLKKMSKKDATTKCKALQEFATLCRESELSAVEGMLPFWPRLYSALAIDTEHRVRETTQLAHAAVVKRVGKGIAMYLKQLAGPWFTSQYDTYPPAASAASNSFNETFPGKKVVDALIHCQREILTYICDNITVQTPVSLSVQKNLTAEEMDAKYQRVLISNLQAYCFYFKKVSASEIEKTNEIHRKIVSSPKFWKLGKHDALSVKTSFFNVLTSVIEHASDILQDEKKKAITTIMNSLDETEPGLLSAVWEALLVAINKIEDWYLLVSVEKLVLPKLWRILRNGGQFCASIIYPNLLPFISQFPKLNIDTRNLLINFFNNMREGFYAKSVQLSRSETQAVITSFLECLRYSILLNINDPDLCSKLLKEQLMPVFETCILENTSMKQVLFCEVTHLVRYWSKNRYKDNDSLYSDLMKQFWAELKILFDELVNKARNDVTRAADICNSQTELLITLKNVPTQNRKNLKVKFASDSNEPAKPESQTKIIQIDDDTVFLSELRQLVNSVCITYFNEIGINHFKQYIGCLNKIVKHFENQELFIALTNTYKTDADFFTFYNDVLKNWLLEDLDEIVHVVELIFMLLKYMSDTDKNKVLTSLTEIDNVVVMRKVLQCGLCKCNRNDAKIKEWYLEPKVTDLLVQAAKDIISGNSHILENQALILSAFEADENGDLLVSDAGINEIAQILSTPLNEKDNTYLSHYCKLISDLVPLTWDYKRLTNGALQILETLFKLCTQDSCINNDLISMNDMRAIWKQGILNSSRKLQHSEWISLSKKFASIIWRTEYLIHEEHAIESLVAIAADFLQVITYDVEEANKDNTKEIILTFLTDSDIKTWIAEVTKMVLYAEVVAGDLCISNICQKIKIDQEIMSIDITSDISVDYTENCLMWALFNTNLLNALYLRLKEENDSENDADTEESEVNKLCLPGLTDILVNIIYVATLGHMYSKHYKSVEHYSNVNKLVTSLTSSFKNLQNYLTEDVYNEILEYFQANYTEYGSMFSNIINLYCTELCPTENPAEYFDKCKCDDSSVTSNKDIEEICLQGIQILQQYQKVPTTELSSTNDLKDLITARYTVSRQEHSTLYVNILDKIISRHKEDSTFLLFDSNIINMSWNDMVLPLEVIRLLTELIKKMPEKLTPEYWDFILISLTYWQLSVNESKQHITEFQLTVLTVAVSQLYYAIQNLMSRHESKAIEELPPRLLDEWRNVFVTDIQTGIIQTWMCYADLSNQKSAALKSAVALDNLGKAITLLDGKILFSSKSTETATTIEFNEVIKLCLKLLQSPLPNIQLSAYHILTHLMPEFVQHDKTLIEAENFDSNALYIRKFEEVLVNVQNIVNTILMDFKLCDTISCTIQPYTDSYTYMLGYLLSWAVILEACAHAHNDLRYQYAEILKDEFFPHLLNNIFKLMPTEVLQENKGKSSRISEMFSTVPSLNFGESWTEQRLDHIVCWLYTNSLRHLPVLVRQWWSTTDSRFSATVDKITTHYVSPMLCQEELSNNKLVSVENMQVKVHPTAREVVALYQMDDTKLELTIILPQNHPLGPVTVETGLHAGGAANWRNCQMQLSIFLTHQNGSVWDGLIMWKRNLDKKFAGVEECYICFSIFHISNYQIPKLSCHTCKKKFHTPCLYKWFNTSQKSTCPICRNVF